MQSVNPEKQDPPPSKVSLIFWNFVISVAGLAALLAIPVLMQRQYDRLHRGMEDHVEPAASQVNHALERAYEARLYAFSSYFLLEDTPHFPFKNRSEFYADRITDWRRQSAIEAHMAYCGTDALQFWRSGTASVDRWLQQFGRQYVETGSALDPDEMNRSETLFDRGIHSLRDARAEVIRKQDLLASAGQSVNHRQTILAIPLAAVCLLLATISCWSAVRLYYWSRKQMKTATQLQYAVREIHHRVNNNLQVLSAMLDISTPNSTQESETVSHVSQHVRTIALVENMFDHERGIEAVSGEQMLRDLIVSMPLLADMKVQFHADTAPLTGKEATMIGLIVGETLLNLREHGAKNASICLTLENSSWSLKISDPTLSTTVKDQTAQDGKASRELISTLVRHDLKGNVTFKREGIAGVEIDFPARQIDVKYAPIF